MTAGDDTERELGGDDVLAAEYVLGVLDEAQRRETARRIDTDAAFAALVDGWEVRLSPMADGYAPVPAPEGVKAGIDRRLFSGTAAQSPEKSRSRPGLFASLAFWRGLTAAAVAALALVVAVPLLSPPPPQPETTRLAAALSADGSDVRYLALFDAATGHVGLSHLAGDRAADRDFELWVIAGNDAPVSLGVIPVGKTAEIDLDPALRSKVAGGAVFAISLEPNGGSPSGAPTGPVVAAGELNSI